MSCELKEALKIAYTLCQVGRAHKEEGGRGEGVEHFDNRNWKDSRMEAVATSSGMLLQWAAMLGKKENKTNSFLDLSFLELCYSLQFTAF